MTVACTQHRNAGLGKQTKTIPRGTISSQTTVRSSAQHQTEARPAGSGTMGHSLRQKGSVGFLKTAQGEARGSKRETRAHLGDRGEFQLAAHRRHIRAAQTNTQRQTQNQRTHRNACSTTHFRQRIRHARCEASAAQHSHNLARWGTEKAHATKDRARRSRSKPHTGSTTQASTGTTQNDSRDGAGHRLRAALAVVAAQTEHVTS